LADGIAVLPQEKIPMALEGIKAVRERERASEERIAAGMTTPDWVKEFLAGNRVEILELRQNTNVRRQRTDSRETLSGAP
jgi:hypothetical protein